MIKFEELRIGNIFLFQGVTGRLFGVNKYCFIQYSQGSDVYNCGIDEIHPIPLTEEILLKCGFEKYAPSIFNEDRYVLGFISLIITTSKDILFNGIHIKHIHQLQNLFYCLCGEELEINF